MVGTLSKFIKVYHKRNLNLCTPKLPSLPPRVSPCFPLYSLLYSLVFPHVSPCFLLYSLMYSLVFSCIFLYSLVFPCIAGFHMTSLNFKLQNY